MLAHKVRVPLTATEIFIEDPMSIRMKVRKRRRDARYVKSEDGFRLIKPFRGLEVVALLRRKRA